MQQICVKWLHHNKEIINVLIAKRGSKYFGTIGCFILMKILGGEAVIISIIQRGKLSTY